MIVEPVKIEQSVTRKIRETKELEELLNWFLEENQKR